MFVLGDRDVAPGELRALCRPGATLRLSDAAIARVAASRAVVERHAAGEAPVYGLNTGLGGNLGYRLRPDEVAAFQEQMIRGRCIGMGEPFPEANCRAALFCRILGLLRGGAGVSPAVLDLLVAMFNAGVTPVVPGRGSIGAGDLGLCAHLAAPVIGRGECWLGGRRLPGAEALAAVGLAPARLGAKDGIALLNVSVVSAANAALLLDELADLLLLMLATAALSAEGYAANPAIFDPRLAQARPAAGQARAAALFRAALDGSALHEAGAPRSVQDALGFRTMAPVFGAALDAFDRAVREVSVEINAASDSPLVLADDDEILSTANFHTPAIALALDALCIAMAHLATASAQRTIKLMHPALTGLPRYLSPVGGASTGLNSLQKTAAYLHAEVRLRATPASLDAMPVSDTVEDHAPQTALCVRKLEEQLVPLRMLTAIEALTAAQAVELRGRPRLGRASAALFDAVRAAAAALHEDRETGPDADAVCAALRRPGLADAIRGWLDAAPMA